MNNKIYSFKEFEKIDLGDLVKGNTIYIEDDELLSEANIEIIDKNKCLVSIKEFYRNKYWENKYITLPLYLNIYEKSIEANGGTFTMEEDGTEDDYYFCNISVEVNYSILSDIRSSIHKFIEKCNEDTNQKVNAIEKIIKENI